MTSDQLSLVHYASPAFGSRRRSAHKVRSFKPMEDPLDDSRSQKHKKPSSNAGFQFPPCAPKPFLLNAFLGSTFQLPFELGGGSHADFAAAVISVAAASAAAATTKGSLPNHLANLFSPYRAQMEELSTLGKGGFGTVMAVRHRLDGRLLAVKRINFKSRVPPWAEPGVLEGNHAKLLREVQVLAGLQSSPNVVRYYHCWLEPDWQRLGVMLQNCDISRSLVAQLRATTQDSTEEQDAAAGPRGSASCPWQCLVEEEPLSPPSRAPPPRAASCAQPCTTPFAAQHSTKEQLDAPYPDACHRLSQPVRASSVRPIVSLPSTSSEGPIVTLPSSPSEGSFASPTGSGIVTGSFPSTNASVTGNATIHGTSGQAQPGVDSGGLPHIQREPSTSERETSTKLHQVDMPSNGPAGIIQETGTPATTSTGRKATAPGHTGTRRVHHTVAFGDGSATTGGTSSHGSWQERDTLWLSDSSTAGLDSSTSDSSSVSESSKATPAVSRTRSRRRSRSGTTSRREAEDFSDSDGTGTSSSDLNESSYEERRWLTVAKAASRHVLAQPPDPRHRHGQAGPGVKGQRMWPYVLFIAMELVEGGQTLDTWMKLRGLEGTFTDGAVELRIFRQVVQGLAAIHAAGLIHRDLKPSNILLTRANVPASPQQHPTSWEWIVKIGDFGLAVHDEEAQEQDAGMHRSDSGGTAGSSSSSSQHTSGVGTASYAAPEQLQGPGSYGPAADLFPLGLILVELLGNFKSGMERAIALTDARAGRAPAEMARTFPEAAAMAEALLSADPAARPTAAQLLLDPWLQRHSMGGQPAQHVGHRAGAWSPWASPPRMITAGADAADAMAVVGSAAMGTAAHGVGPQVEESVAPVLGGPNGTELESIGVSGINVGVQASVTSASVGSQTSDGCDNPELLGELSVSARTASTTQRRGRQAEGDTCDARHDAGTSLRNMNGGGGVIAPDQCCNEYGSGCDAIVHVHSGLHAVRADSAYEIPPSHAQADGAYEIAPSHARADGAYEIPPSHARADSAYEMPPSHDKCPCNVDKPCSDNQCGSLASHLPQDAEDTANDVAALRRLVHERDAEVALLRQQLAEARAQLLGLGAADAPCDVDAAAG